MISHNKRFLKAEPRVLGNTFNRLACIKVSTPPALLSMDESLEQHFTTVVPVMSPIRLKDKLYSRTSPVNPSMACYHKQPYLLPRLQKIATPVYLV